MQPDAHAPVNRETWLQALIAAFVVLGVVASPVFFAAALACHGLLMVRRNRDHGIATAVLGLAFVLVVLGYGVGKDMALRDNARVSASVTPMGA